MEQARGPEFKPQSTKKQTNKKKQASNRHLLAVPRSFVDSEESTTPFLHREDTLVIRAHCPTPQGALCTQGRPCSPGLLMYMWMGFLLLSDCRNSSCAITRLATPSSICRLGCPQVGGRERF
jgi:hypothetical protein